MGTWAWWLAQATAGLAHAVALSCSCNRLYFACNRAVFRLLLPIFCLQLPVLRLLPPWRLAFLESRVASAASYPAWSAVEISRPKVLVFLRLWWDVSTLEGGASTPSGLSLGDPSRIDFHLLFYPLVTPLRRDDQGLLSDEASGFTSCVACDRHFLISNGSWGHNHAALHMQPPVLHTQPPIFCLQLPVLRLLPPWRLAFLESRVASAASYPV